MNIGVLTKEHSSYPILDYMKTNVIDEPSFDMPIPPIESYTSEVPMPAPNQFGCLMIQKS